MLIKTIYIIAAKIVITANISISKLKYIIFQNWSQAPPPPKKL